MDQKQKSSFTGKISKIHPSIHSSFLPSIHPSNHPPARPTVHPSLPPSMEMENFTKRKDSQKCWENFTKWNASQKDWNLYIIQCRHLYSAASSGATQKR